VEDGAKLSARPIDSLDSGTCTATTIDEPVAELGEGATETLPTIDEAIE